MLCYFDQYSNVVYTEESWPNSFQEILVTYLKSKKQFSLFCTIEELIWGGGQNTSHLSNIFW